MDLRNLFRAPRAVAISAQVELETPETPETTNTEIKAPLRSWDCLDLCIFDLYLDRTEIG